MKEIIDVSKNTSNITKNNDSELYGKLITVAGIASTTLATILILVKGIAWLLSDSSAVFASLVDSSLDLCASAVNLLAIRYSIMPKDEDHAYGHGKAESLAGLLQAAFIAGSSVFLGIHGVSRIISPVEVTNQELSIGITLFAIFATIILVLFQIFVVKKTHSNAVMADLLHYKSDILLNFGVLMALVFVKFNMNYMDGIFTVIIAIYIFMSAAHIAKVSSDVLLDHQLPQQDEENIIKLILNVPGISSIHDLRTRKSGPVYFIQLHLDLEGSISLKQAHDITENIERSIESQYSPCDIIIHMEPIETHNNHIIN
ncbi:MAG: cation diffusion facilitator family transporter [Succinivibrionaceae bacterium]